MSVTYSATRQPAAWPAMLTTRSGSLWGATSSSSRIALGISSSSRRKTRRSASIASPSSSNTGHALRRDGRSRDQAGQLEHLARLAQWSDQGELAIGSPVAQRPEQGHGGRVEKGHRGEVEDDITVLLDELPQPRAQRWNACDVQLSVDDQPCPAGAIPPGAHLEPSGHPCPLCPVS